MIFYFSGTGNSAKVAKEIGKALDEDVISVSNFKNIQPYRQGKTVGFVFPVHAWGPALQIVRFIENLDNNFIEEIRKDNCPVWVVMTCGDETGNAPLIIKKLLKSRGLEVSGMWSVIMPNTYVLLPGFDVDSKELEKKKLSNLNDRINRITGSIKADKWEIDVFYGPMPGIKTNIVYPLFKRWGIFPKKWNVSDKCIGCSLCSRICPENNIVMSEGKPRWGGKCVSCLGCYHCCPVKAVNYGNVTKSKGHYNTLIKSL